MTLERLPKTFLPIDEVRTILRRQSKNNAYLNLLAVIPSYFDILANLDYPNDMPQVRDIVYKEGADFQLKDAMIKKLIEALTQELMIDIYSELKGIQSAVELIKRLSAIAAETNCAKRMKMAGATNIRKMITPEDIVCCIGNSEYAFQVKSKANEFFPEQIIEYALVGQMYDPNAGILRQHSKVSFYEISKIRGGFLRDFLKYIHVHLVPLLQNGGGEFSNSNLHINLAKYDSDYSLSATGMGEYVGSKVRIVFETNNRGYIGNAKSAFEQMPDSRFWDILAEKIDMIKGTERLIGWLEISLSFQYEDYLRSKESITELRTFINRYSLPLIAILQCDFDSNARVCVANDHAITLPFGKDMNFLN